MKTRLIGMLRYALREASDATGTSCSRRDFLKSALLVGAGLGVASGLGACRDKSSRHGNKPRIAVIGGGIAGLSTAYFLKKHHMDSTVFEASSRIGGRMFSLRGWLDQGVATDLGAEFVCDEHLDLIDLAKEVGVACYDLRSDALYASPPSFFIEGKERTFEEFVQGLQPAVVAMNRDLERCSFDFTYQNVPAFVQQIDQQSISDYLNSFPIAPWVKRLMEVIFEAEYGMDASEQSALNMLMVLRPPQADEKTFELLGKDYEVLKIKHGTQALAEAVYERVSSQVLLNHALLQYDKNEHGEYELTIHRSDKGIATYTFDYLVMTLPFSLLRDIKTNVAYPSHKQNAIQHIGYGNNCKTILAFKEAAWRRQSKTGEFYTDLLAQCGWDSARAQHDDGGTSSPASMTFFYGGKNAETYNDLSEEEMNQENARMVEKNLKIDFHQYDQKKTTGMLWKDYPFAKCSYTSFRVGEWTKYAGVPQETFERIYFAGEHCSIAFQGFMNGAIQSAKRAVHQLVQQVKTETENV